MNNFKKKITLIANVFPILRTPKNGVKQISKESTFRGPFQKEHGKGHRILSKSELHHIYHIYWSLWRVFSRKNPLLVICKFLRLFLHTLTAVEKSSLLNRDNLRRTIQMQLSQKQKTFSQFLAAFWKARLNFEHLQKKITLIADVFPKLRTPKYFVK